MGWFEEDVFEYKGEENIARDGTHCAIGDDMSHQIGMSLSV